MPQPPKRDSQVLRQSLEKGSSEKGSTVDINQLGGDVLLDPNGIVQLHHVGKGPADRPSVDSLLDVIRQQNSIENLKSSI